jgi:hypothetical protein
MMNLPELESLIEVPFANYPGLNCRVPNPSCQWQRCVPDCIPTVYDKIDVDYSEYMEEDD